MGYTGLKGSTMPSISATRHPELGNGIRLTGTTMLCLVTSYAGTTYAMDGSFMKTVSPQAIGLTVGTIADVYRYYRFRSMRLRYVPACPTTTAGVIRFALIFDGNTASITTNDYRNLSAIPDNFSVAPWQTGQCTVPIAPGFERAYFNALDNTSVAGERQSRQATVIGMWGATQSSTISAFGSLELDYVLDYYGPVPSQAGLPSFNTPELQTIQTLRGKIACADCLEVAALYQSKLAAMVEAYTDRLRRELVSATNGPQHRFLVDTNIKSVGDEPVIGSSVPVRFDSVQEVKIPDGVEVTNSIFSPVPVAVTAFEEYPDAVIVAKRPQPAAIKPAAAVVVVRK